ncbi:DUF3489 domain-containing protein [Sphingopyxis granuli]|uniref:DUF3489 domain-containing protein n=1 Tax=Sphingopyxis granuli TaxID=267128 RepID=UPI001FD35BBB|nr:DUF3489 domain-containing protein [Sphingopyxis granuli]
MNTNTTDTPAATEADTAQQAAQPRKRRMASEPKQAGDEAPKPTAGAKAEKPAKKERGPSKIAAVITLLEREQGATLAQMVEATGWLPHTTRAALTGLKKKGHTVTKDKRDDVTCYRIAKAGE